MTTTLPLFPDPPPERPTLPYWFHEGKNTPRIHVENVRRGAHPLGFELSTSAGGWTCGSCRHLSTAGPFRKCAMVRDQTRGPATDCRQRWRACVHHEPIRT